MVLPALYRTEANYVHHVGTPFKCRERQPERFGPFPDSENTHVNQGKRPDSVSIMPVPNDRILKPRRWSTFAVYAGDTGRYKVVDSGYRGHYLKC